MPRNGSAALRTMASRPELASTLAATSAAAILPAVPTTDPKVAAWRAAGRHLPAVLRDFHDQKAVFRAMHEVQASASEPQRLVCQPSWVEGHCYVIDKFLWFMARHGYTLQRSRAALPFTELDDTLAAVGAHQQQAWTRLLKNDNAEPDGASNPEASATSSALQPRITFAHEVDGPWRLELNGVTLSRHDSRLALELAIANLRRALGLAPEGAKPNGEH